jgi:hypothetical protein
MGMGSESKSELVKGPSSSLEGLCTGGSDEASSSGKSNNGTFGRAKILIINVNITRKLKQKKLRRYYLVAYCNYLLEIYKTQRT